MNKVTQWFLLESEKDYKLATTRYEEIKHAQKGSPEHKEKMLLVHLISEYENKEWDLPVVDPIEIIKIRMEEFGLKPSDLAKEYGNKGNLSKVLNYKRALSITMIRQFSAILRIPTDMLIQEYALV
ncbi:helix-turn-helix domain-containing protein [Pedobacter rhodius]|uniref:XRE family transcriptional regulator n=1 Tax=Pedobacter rhodius TaxID=3004098 RepID=A0ABT4L1E5_9SPHI|nr:XRE family transcriptional regulator [Pedobacter sp. SJ11]MCZ4225003.1 XRE family transcriptional regulator [Pedobacter sp. SJ11]